MTSPNSQAGLTDLSYTGQRDLGMGLMDYKARFYSPTLGRFTQPDTLIPGADNPQAWNRFSYVMNSPILYNDPTGHRPVEDKGGGCVVKAGCSGDDERAEEEYFEEEYGTDDLRAIKHLHDLERKFLDNLLKPGLSKDYPADRFTLTPEEIRDIAIAMNGDLPGLRNQAAADSIYIGAGIGAVVGFATGGLGAGLGLSFAIGLGTGVGSGFLSNEYTNPIYQDVEETQYFLEQLGNNTGTDDISLAAVALDDGSVLLAGQGTGETVIIEGNYDGGIDYYNDIIVPYFEP